MAENLERLEEQVNRLYLDVGRKVREARKKAKLTQVDLAEAVGMTRSSIANLEAGRQRIPLHLLVWVAEILGVPAAELLPDSPVFGDLIVVPDLTAHLVNNDERMRDFVQSTVAKVAAVATRRGG